MLAGPVAVLVAAAAWAVWTLGRSGAERESAASGRAVSRFSGVTLPAPRPKPDFVLTDTSGKPFQFRDATAGVVTLLYFGYTNCPDVCPVQLAQVAAVLRQRPELGDAVKVVFVSVDPERDSPVRIREWLDAFDRRFVGLTGTPAELEAAQRAAGVAPAVRSGAGVNHAAQVIAYAPDGWAYTVYPFGTRQSQWAHDLPLLAAIQPRPPITGGDR